MPGKTRNTRCAHCGGQFGMIRYDSKFCSKLCRKKHKLETPPWRLFSWLRWIFPSAATKAAPDAR
jgi:hypothetical protein